MGLLDNPNMAMAMSLLANSGYSRTPRTFGQNMGEAFGARMQAEEAMRKRQMEQQQFEMQQKKAQYEMQDIEGRRAMGDKLGGLLGSGQPIDRLKIAGMMAPYDTASAFKLLEREKESERPSNLREWDEFQRMTPEQQNRFLEMKRAVQVMNLGGSMAVRGPGGGIREQYPVTPKPEQMPIFKGAQARAEAEAKAVVERDADQKKAALTSNKMQDILNEAEVLLPKATGSLLGAGIAKGKTALGISDESTQANERLRLLAGWAVANVPRMEGPQSNFDVQNYREMAATLGDATKPHKDRLAALNQLRVLQKKYAQPQAIGEFVGDPEQIRREINQIKDPTQRALALKALETQIGKEKQPKPTGGWSIQKVE